MSGTFVYALDIVGDADVAAPLFLRNVMHRRIEAAEVVDTGTCVAHEHFAEAMTHAAVLFRRLMPVLRDKVA